MTALLPVTLWHQAVAAVDPVLAVRRTLTRRSDDLCIGDRTWSLAHGRVRLVAIGKAACGMAVALEKVCRDRLDDGLVITKEGTRLAQRVCRVVEAGHPVPDKRGLRATEALERFLAGGREEDLVICCISGGASALLPAPVAPLTLADKINLTGCLLGSGADITQVNCVRKHCSRLKGGGLARRVMPARLLSLLISDVPGDDPAIIGSGLTAADASTYADALTVLHPYSTD